MGERHTAVWVVSQSQTLVKIRGVSNPPLITEVVDAEGQQISNKKKTLFKTALVHGIVVILDKNMIVVIGINLIILKT